MSEMLFSVVSVTLNCAEDAVATAQSVLAQDFANYEFIVKDGGSTDGTVERLREMGISVQVQKDGGIYEAMNQALTLCQGKYVCFLNAGDLFSSPQILTEVAGWLQQHNSPTFAYGDVISYVGHQFINESGRELRYPDKLTRFYLFRKMICHQTWFVRRSFLLQENGFDTQYRLGADYEIFLKAIMVRKVHYGHIPFVTCTFKGGGLSDTKNYLLRKEVEKVQQKLFSRWELILYQMFFNSLWYLIKKLGYLIYPMLPANLKRRANAR